MHGHAGHCYGHQLGLPQHGSSMKIVERFGSVTMDEIMQQRERQAGRQAAELNSQLCVAAQAGDAVAVEHLLLAAVDPDVAFFRGDTALMRAARQGHSDVVDLLLGSAAAPDLQSADGSTALIWAANCGHAECVRLLLSAGARRTVRDREGRTALQRAEAKGHAEVAALLRT